MSSCKIPQSSVTWAMKIKRLFDLHGISCEVVRLDPSETKRGCGYGVRFDCVHLAAAEALLHKNGIVYSQTIGGGG